MKRLFWIIILTVISNVLLAQDKTVKDLKDATTTSLTIGIWCLYNRYDE